MAREIVSGGLTRAQTDALRRLAEVIACPLWDCIDEHIASSKRDPACPRCRNPVFRKDLVENPTVSSAVESALAVLSLQPHLAAALAAPVDGAVLAAVAPSAGAGEAAAGDMVAAGDAAPPASGVRVEREPTADGDDEMNGRGAVVAPTAPQALPHAPKPPSPLHASAAALRPVIGGAVGASVPTRSTALDPAAPSSRTLPVVPAAPASRMASPAMPAPAPRPVVAAVPVMQPALARRPADEAIPAATRDRAATRSALEDPDDEIQDWDVDGGDGRDEPMRAGAAARGSPGGSVAGAAFARPVAAPFAAAAHASIMALSQLSVISTADSLAPASQHAGVAWGAVDTPGPPVAQVDSTLVPSMGPSVVDAVMPPAPAATATLLVDSGPASLAHAHVSEPPAAAGVAESTAAAGALVERDVLSDLIGRLGDASRAHAGNGDLSGGRLDTGGVPPPRDGGGVQRGADSNSALPASMARSLPDTESECGSGDGGAAVSVRPPRCVIAATGITSDADRACLDRVATLLHGVVWSSDRLSADVTHLVSPCDARTLADFSARPLPLAAGYNVTVEVAGEGGVVRVAKRTLKLMQAVIVGAWIVSMDWMRACLDAQTHVPEALYTVHGDVRAVGAPYLSRLRRAAGAPGLFHTLRIAVAEPLEVVATADMLHMLTLASAESVPVDAAVVEESAVLVVASNAAGWRTTTALEQRYGAVRCRIVDQRWVLDSLSNNALMPFASYAPANPAAAASGAGARGAGARK